jgi:hypothetical protein
MRNRCDFALKFGWPQACLLLVGFSRECADLVRQPDPMRVTGARSSLAERLYFFKSDRYLAQDTVLIEIEAFTVGKWGEFV